MEELLEWYEKKGEQNNKIVLATERCAGGIVQALGKFKLGPHLSPRDRMGPDGIQPLVTMSENGKPVGSGFAQREVVEFNTFFEKWMNGEVPNSAETFQRLTGVIVSPLYTPTICLMSCFSPSCRTMARPPCWLIELSCFGLDSEWMCYPFYFRVSLCIQHLGVFPLIIRKNTFYLLTF